MTYVRVARAAILRYRLEAPMRRLLMDNGIPPKKLRSMPLWVVLKELKKKGLVDRTTANRVKSRYDKYSKTLHGCP